MSRALSRSPSARSLWPNRGGVRPGSLQPAYTRLKQWLFAPLLAPLLRHGFVLRVLTVVAVIQLILTAAGLVGWSCPLKSALGVACPGCGLTTALALLLQGDVHKAVAVHAAAPLALTGLVLLVACSLLPAAWRRRAAQAAAWVEERTGVIPLMVIGSLAYWAARCLRGY